MPSYAGVFDPEIPGSRGGVASPTSGPTFGSPPPSSRYVDPYGNQWDWTYEQNSGMWKPQVSGPAGPGKSPVGPLSAPTWSSPGTPAWNGPGGTTLPPGTTLTTGAATGVQVPYTNRAINPNDPTQRYQAVNITKTPDIAQGETDLMASFKKGADASLKDFGDWLNTFKTSMQAAMGKSAIATNPQPTIDTLQSRQTGYDTALTQAQRDYAALNARTAANEQGIVQQAQDLIPEYDKAAQDAVNQQLGVLQANVSRYKAGSGTPTSLGSAEQELLAKGAAGILVPMEQAKINQRYAVLSNYAMPVAMDIANREQARIGQFDPMVAQQQFQSGQVTAQTINQLQVIAAQMSRTDAVAFLQAMGVPVDMQQKILSGQIGQLGALGQIEQGATYEGLQDVLGAQINQPQYYSVATGAYPNAGRYSPILGPQGRQPVMNQPMTAANAPQVVSPANRYADVVPPGTYYDPTTDQETTDYNSALWNSALRSYGA